MGRIEVTFAPIMELLDQGLRIYRRDFVRFMLLVGLAALPFTIIVVMLFTLIEWLPPDLIVLIFFAALTCLLPLSFYVMAALSRAAVLSAAGAPVRVRDVLAFRPLQTLQMGCYGSFFLVVANAVVSMISSLCFCVLYVLVLLGVVAFTSITTLGVLGEAAAGMAFAVLGFAFLSAYIALLVVNGAVYGSSIYALQPFVHDHLSFVASVQRSFDVLGYRFGANLLTFLSASLVFGATAFAATLAVGLLLPLPALFLLGSDSVVAQAIAATAWIIAIAAATPLLPIWMALLYQRRRATREGEDLAQQLSALTVPPE